jgi:hypothetical protein
MLLLRTPSTRIQADTAQAQLLVGLAPNPAHLLLLTLMDTGNTECYQLAQLTSL